MQRQQRRKRLGIEGLAIGLQQKTVFAIEK